MRPLKSISRLCRYDTCKPSAKPDTAQSLRRCITYARDHRNGKDHRTGRLARACPGTAQAPQKAEDQKIFDDAYIQVLEGLSAGDAICPVMAQELPEGTLVSAIPTGAAAQAAAEAAAQSQASQSGSEG